MTTVSDIKKAVEALPEGQLQEFSSWFEAYEEQLWDRQLEQDQKSGPLRDMMEKARADFEAGKCGRL